MSPSESTFDILGVTPVSGVSADHGGHGGVGVRRRWPRMENAVALPAAAAPGHERRHGRWSSRGKLARVASKQASLCVLSLPMAHPPPTLKRTMLVLALAVCLCVGSRGTAAAAETHPATSDTGQRLKPNATAHAGDVQPVSTASPSSTEAQMFLTSTSSLPPTPALSSTIAPPSASTSHPSHHQHHQQQTHRATRAGDHELAGGHEPVAHGHHERPKTFVIAAVDFDHVSAPFIIVVWIIIAGLAKIGFHLTPKIHQICPESCILIVIGVLIGLLFHHAGVEEFNNPLTPTVFFTYMLPPIILDAGYYMPNRSFFDNFGTILMYAVVATVWNALTVGICHWGIGMSGFYGKSPIGVLECFLFASIISAVDPVAVLAVFEEIHVNDLLYIIVFGESLLNDAVTVVLYRMFETYSILGMENVTAIEATKGVVSFFVVALGGVGIGIVLGFLAAFTSRFTRHVRPIEPLFIFLFGYLAYLLAEMFKLSGILSLTFCGITMKNYVEENISQKSHTTIKYGMKMLANCSETIIFLFLGVTTVNDMHEWNTRFVCLTIVFITVFRTLGVIIFTWPVNRLRLHKLNKVDQFIMSYGGLRGAVAFALVLVVDEEVVPQKRMFVTTTIAVIYFTVFCQGMTIGPLVRLLNVPTKDGQTRISMNERLHNRLFDHLMAGIEDITGMFMGNYKMRDKFKHFNNRFLRPILLNEHHIREPKILETCSKLNLADAVNIMKKNNSVLNTLAMSKENGMSLSNIVRTYTQSNLYGDNKSGVDSSVPRNDSFGGIPVGDRCTDLNYDMNELHWSPSGKDIQEAELHHVLKDALAKPKSRYTKWRDEQRSPDGRNSSLSPTSTGAPLHHEIRLHARRVMSEEARKRNLKRQQQRQQNNNKPKVYSSGDGNNGSRVGKSGFSRRTKSHSQFEQPETIMEALTGRYDDSSGRYNPDFNSNLDDEGGITFVARTLSERRNSVDRPGKILTEAESVLPWKREDESHAADTTNFKTQISHSRPMNEVPSWFGNKDYTRYRSPTATLINRLDLSRAAARKKPAAFNIFDNTDTNVEGKQRAGSTEVANITSSAAASTVIQVENDNIQDDDLDFRDSGQGIRL